MTKPIVYLDLETTGLSFTQDRIVSFAAVKTAPEATDIRMAFTCNPRRKIPEEASAIHGITDEHVKDRPPFSYFAENVREFLAGCDLAGYNLRAFDLPMLHEECERAGAPLHLAGACILDAMVIFKRKESRDLQTAVKFYTGADHVDAHSAIADVEATVNVLRAQLARYPDLALMNRKELHAFCNEANAVDLAGKLVRDQQHRICYNIGTKAKGTPVLDDPAFAKWMMKVDFPTETKNILRHVLAGTLH